MGKLLAICTSPQRGTVKTEVESARLTPEWGIETDAHGGNWHRQVSLLSAEKIENFRKKIWVDTVPLARIWWWRATISAICP